MIAGQATQISRGNHDIRYDALHDEFLVTSSEAILVFRGGADGEEAPIRIIQGPNTQMTSRYVERLDVDPVRNEIFVPAEDRILVFRREANGDVSPIRVIRGPDTRLTDPTVGRVGAIAIDPVHELIVVGADLNVKPAEGSGAMLIFNLTDNGNVKPRAAIQGSKTGILDTDQIQIYPPKSWIVATQSGTAGLESEGAFVGVWSINDNGDVPPRWKIMGPKSMMRKPRGVALNPKYKELIVADMGLSMVLTYYFPEIF